MNVFLCLDPRQLTYVSVLQEEAEEEVCHCSAFDG